MPHIIIEPHYKTDCIADAIITRRSFKRTKQFHIIFDFVFLSYI